ncbi:MAG: sulfatase, partial [Phycisphaerae bacterium]
MARLPDNKVRLAEGAAFMALMIAVGFGPANCKRPSQTDVPPESPSTEKTAAHPTVDAVFLIVIDTLRADRLSCYGCAEHKTPHFDRAAEIGVRFTRAHTVASWTCPSMGAMLTSLYPRQLGMFEQPAPPGRRFEWRERRGQMSNTVPAYAPSIAQMMRSQGFRTAAFVNQPALNATPSFARGFTEYFYPVSKDKISRAEPDTGQRIHQSWSTNLDSATTDEMLANKFAEWVGAHGREKLFAWVHLMAPHVPYAPPAPFAPPPLPDGRPGSNFQRYDGEVRFTDDLVGRMIDAIERHVQLDRAAIILTSDHGEEFQDHGHHGHGHSFYREVNRVPLIVAAPSILAPKTIEADVRIIDIAPTILKLAGVDRFSDGLSGTSLLSVISGRSRPLPVFAEGKLYGNTQRCFVDNGFKLIAGEVDGRLELYDVVADPAELNNLAAQLPRRV